MNAEILVKQLRYLVIATEREGARFYRESFKNIGVSGPQAEVISVLYENEPLTLKELGEMLVCEAGSPSRLVDRMIQDGLVKREVHPKDSRFVLISLTDVGREKACLIEEAEKTVANQLMGLISVDEMHEMVSMLARFIDGLPSCAALKARNLLPESK